MAMLAVAWIADAQSAYTYDRALPAQAVKTLERVPEYLTRNLAVGGTHVWSYSDEALTHVADASGLRIVLWPVRAKV